MNTDIRPVVWNGKELSHLKNPIIQTEYGEKLAERAREYIVNTYGEEAMSIHFTGWTGAEVRAALLHFAYNETIVLCESMAKIESKIQALKDFAAVANPEDLMLRDKINELLK